MEHTRHAADRHDVIEVRGARENNLTGVSLDIPKRRLTVFTRVSGSGKSSAAFSFNRAEGMCPECEGPGRVSDVDVDQLVNVGLSLNEGAITVPRCSARTPRAPAPTARASGWSTPTSP
jgi:excinuclease UvrABC ATPase subunit